MTAQLEIPSTSLVLRRAEPRRGRPWPGPRCRTGTGATPRGPRPSPSTTVATSAAAVAAPARFDSDLLSRATRSLDAGPSWDAFGPAASRQPMAAPERTVGRPAPAAEPNRRRRRPRRMPAAGARRPRLHASRHRRPGRWTPPARTRAAARALVEAFQAGVRRAELHVRRHRSADAAPSAPGRWQRRPTAPARCRARSDRRCTGPAPAEPTGARSEPHGRPGLPAAQHRPRRPGRGPRPHQRVRGGRRPRSARSQPRPPERRRIITVTSPFLHDNVDQSQPGANGDLSPEARTFNWLLDSFTSSTAGVAGGDRGLLGRPADGHVGDQGPVQRGAAGRRRVRHDQPRRWRRQLVRARRPEPGDRRHGRRLPADHRDQQRFGARAWSPTVRPTWAPSRTR